MRLTLKGQSIVNAVAAGAVDAAYDTYMQFQFTAVFRPVQRGSSLLLRNYPAPTRKGKRWKRPGPTCRKPWLWYLRQIEHSPRKLRVVQTYSGSR
jgi:hypothetical protein